jgi:hypothetical protein
MRNRMGKGRCAGQWRIKAEDSGAGRREGRLVRQHAQAPAGRRDYVTGKERGKALPARQFLPAFLLLS